MKSLIPILVFDGSNLPVEEFDSDVKYAMSTFEVTDYVKFRYLLLNKFKEDARNQIHPKQGEYASFLEILDDLTSFYSLKKSTLALKIELRDIVQSTYELISLWCVSKESLNNSVRG